MYEEEQSMLDPVDERPELKKIREEFIANLPKVNVPAKDVDFSIQEECSQECDSRF